MAAPAADPPAIVRLKNHSNFRRSIRRMVAGAMLSAALKDPISPHEDRNAVPEDELSEVRKRLFRACARGRAGPAGGCGGYGVRLFAGRSEERRVGTERSRWTRPDEQKRMEKA